MLGTYLIMDNLQHLNFFIKIITIIFIKINNDHSAKSTNYFSILNNFIFLLKKNNLITVSATVSIYNWPIKCQKQAIQWAIKIMNMTNLNNDKTAFIELDICIISSIFPNNRFNLNALNNLKIFMNLFILFYYYYFIS